MPIQKLTDEFIAAAIEGFVAKKAHIEARIAELRIMMVGRLTQAAAKSETLKRKRRLSRTGREAIVASLRKRLQEKRRHEAEQEQRQAEAKAKRSAALIKARKALLASRKAAKRKVAATSRTAAERVAVKTIKQKATRAKASTGQAKKAPQQKQIASAAAPAPTEPQATAE
jgi:hypothetical protein